MLIKTLLNQLEHFKSFIFGAVTLQTVNGSEALVVETPCVRIVVASP